MNWIYRNKEIKSLEDFSKLAVGFIYEIEFNNGKKYIGSKVLYHKRRIKPLKGKKRFRQTIKESDWKTYVGSSKDISLKEGLKNGKIYPVKKQILKVCLNKTSISYYEAEYLFNKKVLFKDEYYNTNILGKYFKSKILG